MERRESRATVPAPPPVILIVEDDPATRAAARRFFKELGCDVRVSPSGEMALAMLEAGLAPQVILLDFHLAGMSGPHFYRLLRGCPLCQKTAIVPFESPWKRQSPADLILMVGHALTERGVALPAAMKSASLIF